MDIKKISEKMNLHYTTVSRALRNDPEIAEETITKVNRIAKDLGYFPNHNARSLVDGKTKLLGLITVNITNPFFAAITLAMDKTARAKGYTVLLGNTNEEYDRELELVKVFRERRVDGLVVISPQLRFDHFLDIIVGKIPLVLIDRYLEDEKVNFVVSDNRNGAYNAVKHLISLGHKKIGHLTWMTSCTSVRDRIDGYKEALREANIPIIDDFIYHCDITENAGYEGTIKLLGLKERPTAIFLNNDIMAVGAYRAVEESKLKVPDDIAIVGFDDLPFASYLKVPLTTVRQNTLDMGRIAVQRLIDEIEGNVANEVMEIFLPTELIVRESCGILKTNTR